MKKIALLLFLILNIVCQSQEDYIDEFTTLKEMDVVKPITDDYFDLKIYIFMDVNSCMVCQGMIPELEKYFEGKNLKIQKIIFFSGASKKTAEDYKKENNWDYEIITDYNNIYTDYYKITMLPAFLILNNKNQVMFVDKLGGIRTTSSKLDSILNYAKENKTNDVDKRIIKSMPVVGPPQKKIIYTSHTRTIQYLEKTNEYLINSDYGKDIYIMDSNAVYNHKYNLDEMLKQENTSGDNIVDLVFDEESNNLAMCINTIGVLHHLFIYNTITKETELGSLEYIRHNIPKFRAGLDIAYSPKSNHIYLNIDWSDHLKKSTSEKEPQLYIFDLADSAIIKRIIEYKPTIRDNYDIWGFAYTLPLVVEDRLFCTNMFSTELFEFDLKGNFVKKYGIYNSENYRYNPKPMESRHRDEYMYFRGRASINENLLFDKATKKIYIYYQNKVETTKENLKLMLRVPTKHYLVEVSNDPDSKCNEYELPENHVPFYINNGVVRTTTNEDGLKIHIVDLKK
ncbi:MAG: hypothetical protein KC414_00905 [Romboutsia sp.]|nr:hypothetical protein [Romboutsia sp.]MCB9221319.1 hypothetical protein [Ignavibacteria bacterium]